MATNRKKENQEKELIVKHRMQPIKRKQTLTTNHDPSLKWLKELIDVPADKLNIIEVANALVEPWRTYSGGSFSGPSHRLDQYASISCSYLRVCVNLLDAIVAKCANASPMKILRDLEANIELKNTLTRLLEILSSYSMQIQSKATRCEEIEFHHIQVLTWICLARLTFLLKGRAVFAGKKRQEDFRFIDGHAFGIRNPLPCSISSQPICDFGLKEIYTSCSIFASSFRLACTDVKEITGLSIDPSEVCEYIETLMCTYGSYLCFLPDASESPDEFKRIFNQAKFLDPMKEKPSPEFIDGMMTMMQPLYAEKLINDLLRKNGAAIQQGKTPSRAEFLSFFTWLVHLANSDTAKILRENVINGFPDAFVNSSHTSVYRSKNSIGQLKGRGDVKPSQVLLTMTPDLFDEVKDVFKSQLSSVLKFYVRIASRDNVNVEREIVLIDSMRVAAQHVIMELLNTAVRSVKMPTTLAADVVMQNIRVIGGRKSSECVSACGALPGDIYKAIKDSVDGDVNIPQLYESLDRFYLIGLPNRAIKEYKTFFDGIYGYFDSLGEGGFGEIKKVISSAFSRYANEELDADAEVVAYRNAVLTLSDEARSEALNSDISGDKPAFILPSHRLSDLCKCPSDIRGDPTSAYRFLKKFTSSVADSGAASAAIAIQARKVGYQLLVGAYNPRKGSDYGSTLDSMQKALAGQTIPDAINLGQYLNAAAVRKTPAEIDAPKAFDYNLMSTEVEALSVPEEQRVYATPYHMHTFWYLMCDFASAHPMMKASSQFLIKHAMAGKKNFLWHDLLPTAWNLKTVKSALFRMRDMAHMYINVCEFVPIAIDPTALNYSQDPNSYWMQNYNWHSGVLQKIGVRVIDPSEIKALKPWRHISGGPLHISVELKNSLSTEVTVCYISGSPEAVYDGIIRSRFMKVADECTKAWSMTGSVSQMFVMSSTTQLVRDPKAPYTPGAIHAHITEGEKSGGMMENQFSMFGTDGEPHETSTTVNFLGLEAAKQANKDMMKDMNLETQLMHASAVEATKEKAKALAKNGTLSQLMMAAQNFKQSEANLFPPPERSSTLASYKKEVIAIPPSSYSIDSHFQRTSGEVAMLWGLNSTFLQGDSKVYQGVIDKNTKNVMMSISTTRSDISKFYSFLYTCIWKKYDEDHLDYVKNALRSTVINPAQILADVPDRDRKTLMMEGARAVSAVSVAIDKLRYATAFTIEYKLSVYSSVSEIISSGVAAITAGIKQPEQVEKEADELVDAQTGGFE